MLPPGRPSGFVSGPQHVSLEAHPSLQSVRAHLPVCGALGNPIPTTCCRQIGKVRSSSPRFQSGLGDCVSDRVPARSLSHARQARRASDERTFAQALTRFALIARLLRGPWCERATTLKPGVVGGCSGVFSAS